MKWDEFCESVEILRLRVQPKLGLEAQASLDNNQKILQDMQHTRRKYHAAKLDKSIAHPGLIEILQSRRGFAASDPRDRVFAHLGIAAPLPQSLDYKVNVDYAKSASEVYIDLAKTTILSTCSLDILRFVDTSWPAKRNFKLPSWVPDWSLPMAQDPVPPTISPSAHFHHVATNKVVEGSASQFYKIWLGTSPMLTMDGFQLDHVVDVSPEIQEYDLSSDSTQPADGVLLDPSSDSVVSEKCWAYYSNIYSSWQRKEGFQFLHSFPLGIPPPQPWLKFSCCSHDAGHIQFSEDNNSLATQLVNHTCRQHGFPSGLTGKSVASFHTFPSKVGLVPPATRPGDLLCQLWPEYGVILRPFGHAEDTQDDMVTVAIEQYQKSHRELLDPSATFPVVHVSYIGECFFIILFLDLTL